jgi:hypothetical protein
MAAIDRSVAVVAQTATMPIIFANSRFLVADQIVAAFVIVLARRPFRRTNDENARSGCLVARRARLTAGNVLATDRIMPSERT